MLQLLPQFYEMASENCYLHLKEFEEVVNIFLEQNVWEEMARMKLFHFSIKDKAKNWLNSLKPWTNFTLDQTQKEFLTKFFPVHKTTNLKKQIENFVKKPNEQFYECWKKFKELLNPVPHPGFEPWQMVTFFYE